MTNNTFNKYATGIVKGVAILLMLFHHDFLDPKRYKGYTVNFFPFTEPQVNTFALFCKVCVGMFVFITGYGITKSFKKINPSFQLTKEQVLSQSLKRYFSMMMGFWFIYLCAMLIPIHKSVARISKVYHGGLHRIVYMGIDAFGLSYILDTPYFNRTWWYIGLAIILIIFLPMLLRLYHNYGILLLFGILLAPHLIKMEMNDIIRWFPAAILGIWFADLDILDKMKAFHIVKQGWLNKLIKLVLSLILLSACVIGRSTKGFDHFYEFWDGIVPVFVVYMVFEFLVDIKGLNTCLAFLGKHSMNIFLTHTFLRQYYYKDFYYSFGSMWLDLLVLLFSSIAVSISLEFLKRLTRYDKLERYVLRKVSNSY